VSSLASLPGGYNVVVTKTITIRNLSPETKAELRRRAAANGQSLQAYVLQLLIELARRPDPLEIAARVGAQAKEEPQDPGKPDNAR
jgi:plasmid stability protein